MKYLLTILATPVAIVIALMILLAVNFVAVLGLFTIPSKILQAIEDKEDDRKKLVGDQK